MAMLVDPPDIKREMQMEMQPAPPPSAAASASQTAWPLDWPVDGRSLNPPSLPTISVQYVSHIDFYNRFYAPVLASTNGSSSIL
jgi:hypothetical protein